MINNYTGGVPLGDICLMVITPTRLGPDGCELELLLFQVRVTFVELAVMYIIESIMNFFESLISVQNGDFILRHRDSW